MNFYIKKSPSFVKNKKGVALLASLMGILLMTTLAVQFSREALIEYRSSAHAVHKLQAYYAAKSGVEVSLIRIKLYQNILTQFDSQIKSNPQLLSLLNQIWSFPFQWPIDLPDDVSGIVKDKISTARAKSFLKNSYVTVIEPETQRINLYLLISPFKKLQENIELQILTLLQGELVEDQDNSDYTNESLKIVVNNIVDWMDKDSLSRNGGEESSYYDGKDPSIWPPQRPFVTIGEIKLVDGVDEKIFSILKDSVTIYGGVGFNINHLTEKTFRSFLSEQGSEELTQAFEDYKKESGGFVSADSFFEFLEDQGVDSTSYKELEGFLDFEPPSSFRIYSTGISRKTSRSIEVVVFDKNTLKEQFKKRFEVEYLKKEEPSKKQTKTSQKKSSKNSTIVYWQED